MSAGRDDGTREAWHGRAAGKVEPIAVVSRRRQCELLGSWSTWSLTSILLDPAEVGRVRESGWSGTHHTDPETGERIVGTAGGLGFGVDESWQIPREVIAWRDLEAIAKSVPTEVRRQLGDVTERLREHRGRYPRFAASAEAVGCGPIAEGQPLTSRQEAYLRELEAFEASGVLDVWEEGMAKLDAERLELHARALASCASQEPADLLELLEEQPIRQPAHQGPTGSPLDGIRAPEHPVAPTDQPDQQPTGRRPGLRPPAQQPLSEAVVGPAPAKVPPGVTR